MYGITKEQADKELLRIIDNDLEPITTIPYYISASDEVKKKFNHYLRQVELENLDNDNF